MNTSFFDLIDQTYEFPQTSFELNGNSLRFNKVDLVPLIEKYGTPLKISYLPRISEQIKKAKLLFNNAIKKHNYSGRYIYSYCTKSSHFNFVLEEALKNDIHLELSSSFDIDLSIKLFENGNLTSDKMLICNGFKTQEYILKIKQLLNDEQLNPIVVLDNLLEIEAFSDVQTSINLGIRIAAEEEPRFEFYTSRLGIRYKRILELYKEKIQTNKYFKLKMLHFFINTGIKDTTYYWNELKKVLEVYVELKKICPELDMLNLGGGLPIQYTLGFDYDYDYMINSIVEQVQVFCKEAGVEVPNLVTEFGNFTVGESGATIFKVIAEKQQNDRETWYIINSSLMTTLPDIYGINQQFVCLPINNWNKDYKRVNIGGLSCDGMDYYNSEMNKNDVNLPEISENEDLYVGFFHTGAYQESISGFGGIKHCLIPAPKHIVIRKKEDGTLEDFVFNEAQNAEAMLNILGY